ncbi:MAG TPA: helix-turn-helix domain-containing protein [Thermoleophilaceae bacterium]|jgi:DNA-binding XRE family transcriptional regulator
MVPRVREARLAAGLSQGALAAAAGVSRQAVGAIEAGRHRPSVDAALAIARAVGRPVEELFGEAPACAEPVLGAPLPDGSPVLAARVGDRIVYSRATEALAFEGWPLANAVLEDGRPRPLPGGDLDALVVVGCDPALGSAAALLPASGSRHLVALSGSTAGALEAMRHGRAHAALVHNRPGRLPSSPPGVLRLHLARWRVGVASRGRRARSVAELCDRRVRVVQREAGASSQRAFASAVAAHGGPAVAGPVESGHLEVARRVAGGAAAGVTMEPAALRFGLAFRELESHVAELWIDPRWRAHPGVEALGEVLRSQAFTTRMALVGGYELSHCGEPA